MKLFKFICFSLFILCGVLAYRTYEFAPPAQNEKPEHVSIVWDGGAMARFAESIRIPTISNQDSSKIDDAAFEAFHQLLAKNYPKTWQRLERSQPLSHTLLFKWQGSNPDLKPMMLLAHQDVVPIEPGTEQDWWHPPFSGALADGYVWGRGTMDDKVGVIGIMEAVERLLSENFVPERTVYLAFGHDEEVGGKGAQAVAAYLKQQGIKLEFLLDEGGFVTKGLVDGVDGRVAMIGPAEKGFVSFKLIAKAKGGHSSMPPKHTAVGQIASAIYLIERNPAEADLSFTSDTIKYLGDEAPLEQRVIFANLWLFKPLAEYVMTQNPATNAGIRTTAAATMVKGSVKENVLPARAEAVVNFRLIPGDTVDSLQERMTELLRDTGVEIEVMRNFGNNPSKLASTDSKGYQLISSAIQQIRPDTTVVPRIVVGGTDARHYEAVSENSYRFMGIEIGPEELAGMHGTNERVLQESFLDACKIYYQIIKRGNEL